MPSRHKKHIFPFSAQLDSISRLINNAKNVVSGVTSGVGSGNAGSSLIGGSNNFGAGGFSQPAGGFNQPSKLFLDTLPKSFL